MNKLSSIIIIIAAIIASFFLGQYSSTPERFEVVRVDVDTLKSVIKIDSIVYRDSIIEIPANIDTNYIIQDYFTKKNFTFSDTVSEIKIKFTGNLFENKLNDGKFIVQNLRPTQIVKEIKYQLYVGFDIGTDLIAPNIAFVYKNNMIDFGYNLKNKSVVFGYKYKLFEY